MLLSLLRRYFMLSSQELGIYSEDRGSVWHRSRAFPASQAELLETFEETATDLRRAQSEHDLLQTRNAVLERVLSMREMMISCLDPDGDAGGDAGDGQLPDEHQQHQQHADGHIQAQFRELRPGEGSSSGGKGQGAATTSTSEGSGASGGYGPGLADAATVLVSEELALKASGGQGRAGAGACMMKVCTAAAGCAAAAPGPPPPSTARRPWPADGHDAGAGAHEPGLRFLVPGSQGGGCHPRGEHFHLLRASAQRTSPVPRGVLSALHAAEDRRLPSRTAQLPAPTPAPARPRVRVSCRRLPASRSCWRSWRGRGPQTSSQSGGRTWRRRDRLLAAGCWPGATGCWLLGASHGQQGRGCWPLARTGGWGCGSRPGLPGRHPTSRTAPPPSRCVI